MNISIQTKQDVAAEVAKYMHGRGSTLKQAIGLGRGGTVTTPAGDFFFHASESGRTRITECNNLMNTTYLSYRTVNHYFIKQRV